MYVFCVRVCHKGEWGLAKNAGKGGFRPSALASLASLRISVRDCSDRLGRCLGFFGRGCRDEKGFSLSFASFSIASATCS